MHGHTNVKLSNKVLVCYEHQLVNSVRISSQYLAWESC